MNSKHLFAMSIVAVGLTWGGGHAMASDSAKGMAPSGDMNSGSANSGVFSGVPDPNSPGGTKDAGKGSAGNTEIGKVRRGGEPDSAKKAGQADNKKGGQADLKSDQNKLKGQDGKEVGLRTDQTTPKTGNMNQGDRIEAESNDQNRAQPSEPAETTDRRNEKSDSLGGSK